MKPNKELAEHYFTESSRNFGVALAACGIKKKDVDEWAKKYMDFIGSVEWDSEEDKKLKENNEK